MTHMRSYLEDAAVLEIYQITQLNIEGFTRRPRSEH